MKKVTAIVLLLVTMALFAGCAREEVPFEAKTYSTEEPVTAVTVDVRDREIRVESSKDGTFRLDYFESEKEFYNIGLTDGHLTMTADNSKEAKDYVGTQAARENRVITLYLPQGVSVNLTTTNEDISLSALTLGDAVTISNNGGNIAFDTLDVGTALTLDVKNGDISGKVLGGYDDFEIACSIKKGDTNLPESKAGGDKLLTVTANNGDVNIELQK